MFWRWLVRWSVLGLALCVGVSCRSQAPATSGPQRIVSLSPSMTETLFAIGAGESVVGVTDFCDFPSEVAGKTRTGSILQPNYEAIARLRPTLIVGEEVKSSPEEKLKALAPTSVLPWLSVEDVVTGTLALGKLTKHEKEAGAVVEQLRTKLKSQATPQSPRVLLTIAGAPGPFSEVWFVRRNSLHGTVLEASGARNAVAEDVTGAPVLSIERLLALDPDAVVLLVSLDQIDEATQRAYLDAWKALSTLRAVKNNAVHLLVGTDVQSAGPRILGMTERLTALVSKLGATP